MRRRTLSALLAAGLLATGCGDDSEQPGPEIGSAEARATAQRLVNRHWRAVLHGHATLPLFYDERILRTIPRGDLALALYSYGPHFAVKPKVVAVERTPLGLSITTETRAPGTAPIRAGYLVRRVGTDWKILYDTNLAQGLDRLARTQSRLRNPRRTEATTTYLRLRELYLPRDRGGRLLRVRASALSRRGSG